MMTDVREAAGPVAWLVGLAGFGLFELAAYWLLRWLLSALLGSPEADSTVVFNWLRLIGFLLLHIGLLTAMLLASQNWLPRRYRGQAMGWFYAGLALGLPLAITLY